jgi:methyltransferase (TIGR00027 family)
MQGTDATIRDISDTALWVACHRARETERPDAVFKDLLARRLTGERGEEITRSLSWGNEDAWTWTARTWLFDNYVSEQIAQGVDMVINLAAGLDTRPYRMDLPSTLKWVEVDLPGLIAYKEKILAGETPVCQLERISLDLSDAPARRSLFARLGAQAKKALIITEGLVPYFSDEEAASFARDLAATPSFQVWSVDLMSPGLLKMLQKKQAAKKLSAANAPIKFAPKEGTAFFTPHGWDFVEMRSMLKAAAKLKRLNFLMSLLALLPESTNPKAIWGGICLFKKHQ